MDAELLDAVAIVDIDPGQAEEWFDLVAGAYSASDENWDAFSEQLSAAAGNVFGVAAEVFLEYAADHGKTELIGRLVAELPELPSVYASSKVLAEQSAAQQDGASWDAIVAQFGSGWAGWDGSEAGWMQFRDWTYTAADALSPDLYVLAYDKLNPLDELPVAERIAILAELGFTINAESAQLAQPSASPWETVVEEFGSGWTGWDGSEAGWAQFRDWTYAAANAQSPELYAAAYEKLNPLNGLAPAELIAELTELGLAISVSAESDEEDDPAELDAMIDEALAEALKEVPGAESLTAEELEEIRAEIAQELMSEDAD